MIKPVISFLLVFLVFSCQTVRFNNFSNQKFTDLKKISTDRGKAEKSSFEETPSNGIAEVLQENVISSNAGNKTNEIISFEREILSPEQRDEEIAYTAAVILRNTQKFLVEKFVSDQTCFDDSTKVTQSDEANNVVEEPGIDNSYADFLALLGASLFLLTLGCLFGAYHVFDFSYYSDNTGQIVSWILGFVALVFTSILLAKKLKFGVRSTNIKKELGITFIVYALCTAILGLLFIGTIEFGVFAFAFLALIFLIMGIIFLQSSKRPLKNKAN